MPTLDQSGAERQLCLLATELAQSADVSVIALNRGGFYASQLKDAGISVHVLEKRFRFDPLTFVRLRSLLWKSRPHIIQSFLFSANTYVRLPGVRPGGSKVIVSERCVDSWKSGWQLSADRRLAKRMDAMTANSHSVADFYRTRVGVPDNLINVISNGIPLRSQQPAPATDQTLRSELGVSDNTKLVGFVGRLAAQKCLKDLVWSFQLLHQVVEDVRLVFIGDGPERDNLAELLTSFGCRNKAHFLGHRDDAQQLMPQLNAFCLPSLFEGMSNSLMEAMASGVPAVVSDIPANLELIQHEQTGLVFPQGNGPEITKSLKKILDDDALAKKLASAALKHIQQQHSVELMIQKHLDLYNRLTS
ncbi:MAG: glycosyltransferase [Fuerstiella sp.]